MANFVNDSIQNYQTETDTWLPVWLRLYLGTLILVGLFTNGFLLVATSRTKVLGWTSFIFYLAVIDILTLVLLAPCELMVLVSDDGVWRLPKAFCIMFIGSDVTLGSAAIYFVVSLTLHATCVSPDPPPRASFVIVWLLAASLGIPHFLLAETVFPRPHLAMCTIPNGPARTALFFLVVAFKVVVPVIVLLPTSLFASLRLKHVRKKERHLLKMALVLVGSYAVFSLHRAVFCALHVLLPPITEGPDAFKVPPLTNSAVSSEAAVIFSSMHYFLSASRPLVCFIASPSLRKAVTKGRLDSEQ